MVRNGTTGQAEPAFMGQEGHLNSTDDPGNQRTAAETTDMFSQGESLDYVDIPAFLRNQAD